VPDIALEMSLTYKAVIKYATVYLTSVVYSGIMDRVNVVADVLRISGS
jgi:hypothetical protein